MSCEGLGSGCLELGTPIGFRGVPFWLMLKSGSHTNAVCDKQLLKHLNHIPYMQTAVARTALHPCTLRGNTSYDLERNRVAVQHT